MQFPSDVQICFQSMSGFPTHWLGSLGLPALETHIRRHFWAYVVVAVNDRAARRKARLDIDMAIYG